MNKRAYQPFVPAKRPGRKPNEKPNYRILVHRKFLNHWNDLVDRIGLQGAEQFWDHVATTPGSKSGIASITILKGKAGKPMGDGWSPTYHYEISGSGRIDYQFHNAYRTSPKADPHAVAFIRTIDFSSH